MAGCNLLETDQKPFPWAEPGARFLYDYHGITKPLTDHRTGVAHWQVQRYLELRIERPANQRGATFAYHGTGTDIEALDAPAMALSGLDNFERTAEGLAAIRPRSCGGSWLFKRSFSALRVPARPRLGGRLSYYRCGEDVEETYDVVSVDTVIAVPAGTFKTFVLQQASWPTREYWSEQHGLIKVEFFEADGTASAAYELSSTSL